MNSELEDKLIRKYPKFFRQKDLPMSKTCCCADFDGQGLTTCGSTCPVHYDIQLKKKIEEQKMEIERFRKKEQEREKTIKKLNKIADLNEQLPKRHRELLKKHFWDLI